MTPDQAPGPADKDPRHGTPRHRTDGEMPCSEAELRAAWAVANASDGDRPPRPGPEDRRARHRIAPLVATLLLIPLMPVALLLVGLSAMATDSCMSECSQELLRALDTVHVSYVICLITTLGSLTAAWTLPRHRFGTPRAVLSLVAVLAQLVPVLLMFRLPEG